LDSIPIWTLFESGHYCVSKNIVKLQSNFTIQNIDMTVVFTENKGILFLKLILYRVGKIVVAALNSAIATTIANSDSGSGYQFSKN